MLSKRWYVVLVVLGLAAFGVNSVFAAGGAKGAGRGTAFRSHPNHGNVQQVLPAGRQGFFASSAYGNGLWGWGGSGGLGWGYPYPGWAFQLEGVPYFAQYPPVYYDSAEGVPVLNPAIRSPWLGIEGKDPAPTSTVRASMPRPPLRIVNPYFVEEKAENPPAPLR